MGATGDRLGFLCSFSDDGDGGIVAYRHDGETGALTESARLIADGASFLALGPDAEYLYSVNRIEGGVVMAHEIDHEDGRLSEINRTSSEGAGPAYVSVDAAGEYAFVANYAGGTVAMFPIRDDGGIGAAVDVVEHEGSSVDPDRQTDPHPHSIAPGPNDQYVYAPDLGTDEVWVYEIDRENDQLGEPVKDARIGLHDGAGPRHLDFHPERPIAYVINELDSTVTTFRYEAATGSLSELDRVSALPERYHDESYCADIHVHPSGDWVYGSNRGHDSIAVFEVDETDATLSTIEHVSTGGHWPRNFAIDPSGRFLYVENRRSDNVVPFKIDRSAGTLDRVDRELTVTEPICLEFVEG